MAEAGQRAIRPDRTTLAAFVTSVTLAGGNVIAVPSVSCEDCELDPLSASWLQEEEITWAFAACSVLVLTGVYVGALRRPG
jgi:hypothetical protein